MRTLNWEEEITSQIEMVKSQTVVSSAQRIVSQFYPTGYTTDRKVQVEKVNSGVVTTSNVIWVTYSSDDRVFVEAAVNAIVTAYREYYSNTKTPPEMEDFFSQEIERLHEEIEYWREHKEKVLKEGDLIALEDQRRNLLSRIAGYENDVDDVVRERREMESVIERLDGLLDLRIEDLAAISSNLTGSQLEEQLMRDLRVKLQELRIKESEYAGKYTDRNPEVQRVRQQIEDLRQMVLAEIRTQILLNKNKLLIIEQKEETLRQFLAKLEIEKARYPKAEIELERIDAALTKLKRTYDNVVEQQMRGQDLPREQSRMDGDDPQPGKPRVPEENARLRADGPRPRVQPHRRARARLLHRQSRSFDQEYRGRRGEPGAFSSRQLSRD